MRRLLPVWVGAVLAAILLSCAASASSALAALPACSAGVSQRRDIRDLRPGEWQRFIAATRALQARPGGPSTLSRYDQLVAQAIAAARHVNGFPQMFAWNRYYLREFERTLQSVDPAVTVPYWDWTVGNSSPELTFIFGPGYMGGNGTPPADGPFANWAPALPVAHPLSRRFARGSSTGPFYSAAALAAIAENAQNYDQFTTNMSQPNSVVRAGVGGDMATDAAPNDPLFFVHAAFMDKLWADWQALAPEHATSYGGTNDDNTPARPTDTLVGFPAVTVGDVLDTSAVCVHYVEPQAGPGPLIVSELRLRGPGEQLGVAADYYFDLYNTTDSPVDLTGWKLAFTGASGQVQTVEVSPSGATLAPGASFLVIGGGYTLGSANAPDRALDAVIDPRQGVAVIAPDGSVSDAVGVTGAAPGYIEGSGLIDPQAQGTAQFAYVRRFKDGVPVDTRDNRGDFALVSTDPSASGPGAQLGAPAPRGTGSPTARNDILQSGLLDSSVPAQAAPNLIDSSDSPRTLTINRTLTNCSGQPSTGACANAADDSTAHAVGRLWFRVTGLTTIGSPGAGGSQAVLEADNSSGEAAVSGATQCGLAGQLSGDVQPLTLLAPSTAGLAGLNSTWSVTLPNGGLQPGQCINIEFTFDVLQAGTFTFAYNTEDDLEAPATGSGGAITRTPSTPSSDGGGAATVSYPTAATTTSGAIPTSTDRRRAPRSRSGSRTATASAANPRISMRTAVLPVACRGAAGTTCRVTATLFASALKVAQTTITLRAGAHRYLVLRLNALGRRLLAHRRALVTSLTLRQRQPDHSSRAIATKRLVFDRRPR